MWLDPALAPFSRWTDAVLLAARLIMGVVMLYYGWPKIRDPGKNAKDFDATGFRPGWLFGTLVLAAEFFGGILVLLGLYVWVAAAAFGFEMMLGTVVKTMKWHKPSPTTRTISCCSRSACCSWPWGRAPIASDILTRRDETMKRLVLASILVIVLGGCATTASNPMESKDRAECKEYARTFEHSRRVTDACLISRGHVVTYSTNGGGVEVRSKAEPRQPAEVIARDLKACNDESGMGYVGRLQFRRCMDPRGYAVTNRD